MSDTGSQREHRRRPDDLQRRRRGPAPARGHPRRTATSRTCSTAATRPNDRPQGVTAHGTTAYEESVDETIDERIRQEVPDPDSAYGAPDNESGLDDDRVGGDDPDSIDAEDDWLGDNEVGDARAGRLVADDEGAHEDDEKQVWASDVGVDGAGASAEEAAMHIVDEIADEPDED